MGGRQAIGIGLIGLALVAVMALLGGLASLLPHDALECPEPGARVVLDPGHGGDDPGAINDGVGLVERELVLDIARRSASLLEAAGYSVALTRTDNATGYLNTPRGVIANACHGFAYVSIHLNSFGEPEPNYAKTFWGIEAKDAEFAAVMQLAMLNRLQPGTELGDSGLEQLENGGLLTARMPAVLIEPLFLSNPDEAARLAAPDGARLEAIAQSVADGVDVWLRLRGHGPIWHGDGQSRILMRPTDPLITPSRGSAGQAIAAGLAAGAQQPLQFWAYVAEVYRLAPAVGLDPAIVIAQSALETGWWQSEAWIDHLNPAGIGITGPEAASPSWASGVDAARAQLVHLSLYASGPIPPDHPLAPFIALDPRYDDALAAGRANSAPRLADLAGRWATDPNYATSIARVGTRIFSGR